MFEAAYYSPWHNPLSFWLITVGFLAAVRFGERARSGTWLTAFLLLFGLEISLDALAQGELSPLAGSTLLTPVSIAFVILGDFRFFLLLTKYSSGARSAVGVYGMAAAIALVVPLLSGLSQRLMPDTFADMRHVFLAYELALFTLTLGLRLAWYPRRYADVDPAVRRWIGAVMAFELVQYGLWASADMVILAGSDLGYALRLVPNTLYYALFLPFVWWKAPREAYGEAPA